MPLILVGLGVIVLLPLLFIPARILLRKRLVPLPAPKLPPSGAAPWSRSPVSAQAQPGQSFPYAPPGNNPFYTPASNGAPFPGYGSPASPQLSEPFATPPVVPGISGYAGLTQHQQPLPTTPALLPDVQVELTGQQPGTPVSPASPDYSLVDASQPGDAANSAVRKRLRRDRLRTSGEHMALGGQISDDVSADMMVVSDPYLRAMLKQYSQKEQVVQQAPEEFDVR